MRLYGITQHAIERAVERLAQPKAHAHNYLNQLMVTAMYRGDDGQGRIFDHYKSRTRIVLDRKIDKIVTVYSMDTEKGDIPVEPIASITVSVPEQSYANVIITKARATINREITKARRQFTREFRSLSESQALIQIEIAEMSLRKVRAKNPNTQAVIQAKIDVALDVFDEIGSAIGELRAEFTKVEREANAFLPIKETEVTA